MSGAAPPPRMSGQPADAPGRAEFTAARAVSGRAQAGDVPVPPPPGEASALFGLALPVAERYAQLLAGPGVERGLIGPHETSRLWDRHLVNCAALAELISDDATVIDVGSGAGLPGVVLAMLLPGADVVLLEPMARRATFLQECIDSLGLTNASVCCRRAEDVTGELTADVVTARAVAPLDRLAGLALGLARPGGIVLAMKGASADREIAQARPALRAAGIRDVQIVQAGAGTISLPAVVVRFSAPRRSPGSRRRSKGPAGRGAAAGNRALPSAGRRETARRQGPG
jgi:16S rRNA (guanine527-N7)-methyltransferase